jgi:anti-sigma factor (TIGR02949 family)
MGAGKDSCARIVEKMYLVLEGEESASVCEALRRHMRECEACSEQYRVLEDLVSLCRKFPDEEVPEDQKKRMKDKLLASLAK